MKVTRDVIYDLLPSYFAGDASDDTRALVEAYFDTDPEFARMASRFQSLLGEHQRSTASASDREREAFTCARMAAELPQKARASALGCGFASLLSFVVAFATWNDRMGLWNPGVLLGVCFGAMALLIFAVSFRIKPDSWWRGMAGLDDASLDTLGMSRRRRRHHL